MDLLVAGYYTRSSTGVVIRSSIITIIFEWQSTSSWWLATTKTMFFSTLIWKFAFGYGAILSNVSILYDDAHTDTLLNFIYMGSTSKLIVFASSRRIVGWQSVTSRQKYEHLLSHKNIESQLYKTSKIIFKLLLSFEKCYFEKISNFFYRYLRISMISCVT